MKAKQRFIGFDALKRTVSMVQILERYDLIDRLHRSRDSLTGTCPLHAGHNKTQFRVSISKNCWICFGDCHCGGSIIDFISRKEGIGIRDAALLIQDWFQPSPNGNGRTQNQPQQRNGDPKDRSERSSNPPLRFELKNLDRLHPYLAERGLSQETLRVFGVGYCSVGALGGWIAIPIHNAAGQLVAYAGRWPGEAPQDKPKYRLPRGFRKSVELFNLHRARSADTQLPLIVVEGFFGCMKLWQLGHHRVVSTMGSMLSEAQAKLNAVGPNGHVLLMFDEDEAGRNGRHEAKTRLEPMLKVSAVSFTAKGMQPDRLTAVELQRLLCE